MKTTVELWLDKEAANQDTVGLGALRFECWERNIWLIMVDHEEGPSNGTWWCVVTFWNFYGPEDGNLKSSESSIQNIKIWDWLDTHECFLLFLMCFKFFRSFLVFWNFSFKPCFFFLWGLYFQICLLCPCLFFLPQGRSALFLPN